MKYKTIEELKIFYDQNGFITIPYSQEEIEQVIQKVGNLPQLLIEYYQKIGYIFGQDEFYEYMIEPKHLSIRKKEDYFNEFGWKDTNDYLCIATEMQGCTDYAIAIQDLTQDNPLIYMAGEMYADYERDHLFITNDEAKENDCSGEYEIHTLMDLLNYLSQVAIMEGTIYTNDEIYYTNNELEFLLQNIINKKIDFTKLPDKIIKKIIEKTKKLTILHLADCHIMDLSLLEKFSFDHLLWLDLSNNNITDLTPLQKLTNLQGLKVKNNHIEDITILKNLTKLKALNIAKNNISDISILKNLTQLEVLNIEENNISVLPTFNNKLFNIFLFDNNSIDENQIKVHKTRYKNANIKIENNELILVYNNK